MLKKPTTLAALLTCIALPACGPDDSASQMPATDAPAAHDHSSMASHGGTIVELGDHVAILEIVHDGVAGVVSTYVMDASGAPLAVDGTPVLNLSVDDAPVQVEGAEVDGAWTFTSDALQGHVHGARFRLSVGGKTFSPDLPDVH